MSMRLRCLAVLLAFGLACTPLAALPLHYEADLSGPAESPPNASPGSGTADVWIDLLLDTLQIQVVFDGLLGTATAAHIHCCAAPPLTVTVATVVPTFPGFPLGVTSGSYDHTFDLSDAASYNPAFVTGHGGTVAGARAALLAGLDAGEAYLNIHTSLVGSGEIRGFLTRVSEVPEPSSLPLTLLGAMLGGAALLMRPTRSARAR